MNTIDMVAESNRIEGIHRAPTEAEVSEHVRFTNLDSLSTEEIQKFVSVYQPSARLRDLVGLNVRVGGYIPPAGGPEISHLLATLLADINTKRISAYHAHLAYEDLHPFTDGNGRSGRAIWYWMMRDTPLVRLGFLHSFYYQTLAESEK